MKSVFQFVEWVNVVINELLISSVLLLDLELVGNV